MTAATWQAAGAALTGATRTTSSVPVPSGVASGSILTVHLYLEATSAVTPPAGFTELTFSPAPETTGTVTRQRVWWKRATGADTGTYDFTHASTWTSGVANRFAAAVASGTPTEVVASAQRSSAGTVTPTVSGTTSGGDRLLVFGATVGNSSEWSAPSGFTEVFDPAGDELMVAVKAQGAAGSTGPLAATSTSSAFQTVTLIAIVPASVSSDTTAPSVPTGLVATPTSASSISLSWTASTDDVAVTGYTVKRGGTTIASGVTGTSYGDSGLSAATLYSYTASAQDAAGNSSADSSPATATTFVAAPPSLTVTPTVESGNVIPRVRLNVVDTRTTQATQVTVMRLDPDGNRSEVRTVDGGPLPLSVSGGTRVGLVYDYEAPYGVPVSYSTVEAPGTVSFEVTLDSEDAWLIHPGVPELSVPIELRKGSLAEETWGAQEGVYWPMGREFPVVQTDGTRKAPASSVTVAIDTAEQLRALKALLYDMSVLLLNIPVSLGLGIDTCYIAVGDVKNARVSDIGSDAYRAVELPFRTVDRPAGGTQAERTYTDLLAFPTYAALNAAYSSYTDLLAGP